MVRRRAPSRSARCPAGSERNSTATPYEPSTMPDWVCVRPSSSSQTGISGMAISHIARSKNASVAISAARRISGGRTGARIRAARGEQRCMQLGMVGLGRMGANMVRRVMGDGHECVVYNRSPEPVQALVAQGAIGVGVARRPRLEARRAAPRLGDGAGRRGDRVDGDGARAALLSAGDCIIDGGNSYYKDDVRRSELLAEKGINYLDVGTSGGIWGLERGYCLMIGGPKRRRAADGLDLRVAGARPGRHRGARAAARTEPAPPRTATCTAARRAPGTS